MTAYYMVSAGVVPLETFEDVIGNWVIDADTSGVGSTVERSNEQASSGTYSAKCFTTNASAVAQVRDTITGSDEYYWQRLRMYIPAATVNALTSSEYMAIAGAYASAGGMGWWLQVREGGELYCSGYREDGTGPSACDIYAEVPIDQWFTLEFCLFTNSLGFRDFAVIVNGAFYGFYRRGDDAGTVDRLAAGILETNSSDDLTVYVDTWYQYTTGSAPTGSDNRPTGNSYTKDYTLASGENIEAHYGSWPTLTLNANGLNPVTGFQGALNHMNMPSLLEGWGQITIEWENGDTPTWPPVVDDGDNFTPRIMIRKDIVAEENLTIGPKYQSGDGNVLLTYFAYIGGHAHVLATWQMPTDSGHAWPGDGDKIRVKWEEATASTLHVTVDYYDASADSWTLAAIDTTDDLTDVGGHGTFMDADHNWTTMTLLSEYSISSHTIGTLDTFPS